MSSPLRVDALVLGDDATSWRDAGFAVEDASTTIGATAVECRGDGSAPRWRLWADGTSIDDDVDGIGTETAHHPRTVSATRHPNHVVEIDHLVVASPDLDRTTERFADLGVECRRIRDVPGATGMQQRFFRLGSVIIELVGAADAHGDGPATIWGLAFTVDDIDAATAALGSACGPPKDAVQPGRRIATMRTRELGISLPIALMTASPPRR